MGDEDFGISPDMLKYVAREIESVVDLGVQIGIIVGGGNIFRGVAATSYGMERASADHMGMLATVINALALSSAIERAGRASGEFDGAEAKRLSRQVIKVLTHRSPRREAPGIEDDFVPGPDVRGHTAKRNGEAVEVLHVDDVTGQPLQEERQLLSRLQPRRGQELSTAESQLEVEQIPPDQRNQDNDEVWIHGV